MQELLIDPWTAKIVVFILVLLSVLTGNVAYFRLKKYNNKSGKVKRQYYHIIINILTLLSAIYLVVVAQDTGWIVLMLVLTSSITGIFTYRNMKIQTKQDKEIEKPRVHAIAGLILVFYTGYMWIWEAIGIGGLFFA